MARIKSNWKWCISWCKEAYILDLCARLAKLDEKGRRSCLDVTWRRRRRRYVLCVSLGIPPDRIIGFPLYTRARPFFIQVEHSRFQIPHFFLNVFNCKHFPKLCISWDSGKILWKRWPRDGVATLSHIYTLWPFLFFFFKEWDTLVYWWCCL